MERHGARHSSTSAVRTAANLCMGVVLTVTGCIDPYPPPVSKGDVGFLVVDGFLNSGSGLASVKLSRALPLEATTPYPTVEHALVQVERDNGSVFSLVESSPGRYEAVRPDLHIGSAYRLLVRTTDGKDFESDFVVLKQSPQLEDVSWTRDGDGITIHVDSRDPSGSTRYYQWVYTETWEYDADRQSGFYVRNGLAVPRHSSEQIYICYFTVESSKVLISTTSDQSVDFINDYPLVHIPIGSKKLSRHYRIQVQQRALDESSYNYWLQLQRTTESLGGLFDPLPARVTGNIRAKNDPGQTVLGYFSGGGVQEKQLYIDHYDLPLELRTINRKFCGVDSILLAGLRNYLDGDALIGPYGSPLVIGYTVTTPTCMDCRSEGGVLTKPANWPF